MRKGHLNKMNDIGQNNLIAMKEKFRVRIYTLKISSIGG